MIKKKRVYFRPLMSLRVYSNRFLLLRNRTGMVASRALYYFKYFKQLLDIRKMADRDRWCVCVCVCVCERERE